MKRVFAAIMAAAMIFQLSAVFADVDDGVEVSRVLYSDWLNDMWFINWGGIKYTDDSSRSFGGNRSFLVTWSDDASAAGCRLELSKDKDLTKIVGTGTAALQLYVSVDDLNFASLSAFGKTINLGELFTAEELGGWKRIMIPIPADTSASNVSTILTYGCGTAGKKIWIDEMKLVQVPPLTEFTDFSSISAGGEINTDLSAVNENTTEISVKLNARYNEINRENIYLENENGDKIDFDCNFDVTDNTLTIYPKEYFTAGSRYKLGIASAPNCIGNDGEAEVIFGIKKSGFVLNEVSLSIGDNAVQLPGDFGTLTAGGSIISNYNCTGRAEITFVLFDKNGDVVGSAVDSLDISAGAEKPFSVTVPQIAGKADSYRVFVSALYSGENSDAITNARAHSENGCMNIEFDIKSASAGRTLQVYVTDSKDKLIYAADALTDTSGHGSLKTPVFENVKSGYMNIKIIGDYASEAAIISDFFFVSSYESNFVKKMFETSSADEIYEKIEEFSAANEGDDNYGYRLALSAIGAKIDDYMQLSEEAKRAVCKKVSEAESDQVDKFNAVTGVKRIEMCEKGDIAAAVEKYKEELEVDSTVLARLKELTDKSRAEWVLGAVCGANFDDKDDFNKKLDEFTTLGYINSAYTYQLAKEAIGMFPEFYGDILKSSGYSGLNDDEKISTMKQMIVYGTAKPYYTSKADVSSALTKAVSDSKKPLHTVTAGKGGGGGSFSLGRYVPEDIQSDQQTETKIPETAEPPKRAVPNDEQRIPDWAKEAMLSFYSEGIMNGNENGDICPNEPITREEFVKTAVNCYGLDINDDECDFTDADKNEWYYPYIVCGCKHNIIQGYDDGRFGVGDRIIRQDMAVIMSRLLKDEIDTSKVTISDYSLVAEYAREDVKRMYAAGIIQGDEKGNFNPNSPATRAEAAKMMYLLRELIYTK